MAKVRSSSRKVEYKTFKDKHDSTHTYAGDGQEQVDFFDKNSNYNELIDNMSTFDRDAFEDWANGEFMDGAQYGGWDNMRSYEKRDTQQIDDVLDKSVIKKGVVVTRLAGASLILGHGATLRSDGSSINRLKAQKGKIVLSKGCMSTGVAAEGLTIGQPGKLCEYKIHVPPSKGAGMWIGDNRINGWGRQQREFITNRDSYFQMGDVTWDAGRKKYVIDVYWMGRDQHDYGSSGRLSAY